MKSNFVTPTTLIPLLYGTQAYLDDLNAMNGAGKRLDGGFSLRIQMAAGYRAMAQEALLDLATSDPDEAAHIEQLLSKSSSAAMVQLAGRLRERMAR